MIRVISISSRHRNRRDPQLSYIRKWTRFGRQALRRAARELELHQKPPANVVLLHPRIDWHQVAGFVVLLIATALVILIECYEQGVLFR